MSKDQKAFDYEDETISDEDKLKQVNEDYKQGGVNLMSEDEKKEQETTTEGKWTLSKDKLWISSTDSDMKRIQVKIERTAVPASNNFYYSVVLRDTKTGASARSSISKLNDAITELIDSGAILLYRPKNSKILQRLIDKAIEDTAGNTVGKNSNGQVTDNSHAVLGWRTVSGHDFYFGNRCISAREKEAEIIDSVYVGENVIRMVQRGTVEGWVEANNNYISTKIVPSIVMISSFAGMFRQRYKSIANDTQLVISIVGESSSGKTTLVRAAHSVYTSCEEYLGYSTSLNSRTKRLALRNPIVASIDDVLQLSSLKDRKPEDINELIFSLASGMSKDRLGLYGTLKEQEKFDSTVLLTSTETLLNLTGEVDVGQLSRLIELKVKKTDVATDKTMLKEMMDALEGNCGQAAEAFAEALIDAEQAQGKEAFEIGIKEEYDTVKADVIKLLENEGVNNTRFANRIALIVLLGEQLNERLKTTYKTEIIKKYLVSIAADAWKNFTRVLNTSKTPRVLAGYFAENQEFFHKGIIDAAATGCGLERYLGIWEEDGATTVLKIPCGNDYNRIGAILYGVNPEDVLAQENGSRVESMSGINPTVVDKCIRYMRDKGLSVCKQGSLYNKITFIKKAKQLMGYEFRIPTDLIQKVSEQVGETVELDNEQSEILDKFAGEQ